MSKQEIVFLVADSAFSTRAAPQDGIFRVGTATAANGPVPASAAEQPEAQPPLDLNLLLLPLRTMRGTFAWIASAAALGSVARALAASDLDPEWDLPVVEPGQALLSEKCGCVVGDRLYLEEFSFNATVSPAPHGIGQWLAGTVFPKDERFNWWRGKLGRDLVILADEDFGYFASVAFRRAAELVELPAETICWAIKHPAKDSADLSTRLPQVLATPSGALIFAAPARRPELREKAVPSDTPPAPAEQSVSDQAEVEQHIAEQPLAESAAEASSTLSAESSPDEALAPFEERSSEEGAKAK